ncbi:MAG: hypothetical protein ACRCUP_07905 [Mycoplasmatales bacterium]
MELCNIQMCNLYETHKILKHKWLSPIIKLLKINKSLSFTDLLQSIAYISNGQLSKNLSFAIEKKLIDRDENGYYLTNNGHQLYEIIKLMDEFTIN